MTSDYIYNCKIPQLNSVEKTFVWLIVSYLNYPTWRLDSHLCSILTNTFSIPEGILAGFSNIDENALRYNRIRFVDGSCGGIEYHDSKLLKSLLEISFAMDALEKSKSRIDIDLVDIFTNVYNFIDFANSSISYHEWKSAKSRCDEPAPFNNSYYNITSLLDSMRYLVLWEGKDSFNQKFLQLIVMIARFELYSQCRVVCVIAICQALKTSPFVEGDVAKIASEFHDLIFFILHNSRLYSLQTNILKTTPGHTPQKRDASDNTTRLRMCYGYSNYDAYVLRLDLAHKGESFVHINNESPARISCCIFSEADYQRIIRDTPCAKDFFIKYGNRYALKERNNCNLTDLNKSVYYNIAKEGAHFNIFSNNYSENSIEVYLTHLSTIFSGISKKIRKGDEYSATCFHYNRIMMLARLLYSAYCLTNKGCIDKAIETIIQTGIKYNIISAEDVSNNKLDVVFFIFDYVIDALDSVKNSFI